MVLTASKETALGSSAPDFSLPDVYGQAHTLADFADNAALVVMFICNHCPYVQAVEDRLIALGREYAERHVAFVAVMPNDVTRYPADHPQRMRERVEEKGYPFPYLYDESQEVARAYGAVCTPDLFVYDADRRLAYRGRLDDNWKQPNAVTREDLRSALEALLAGDRPDTKQVPSMGCSIKWRSEAP